MIGHQIDTRPSATNFGYIEGHRYHVAAIQQTVFQRGWGSATLWFLCYWQIRLLTTITRYMMLKTCPWKLTKNTRLKACMKASLQSLIRSWKSPCIWWEILISLGRLYDRQNLHFNLSYTNNPIMVYRTMRSFGSIPNDLENNNVICHLLK